LFLVAVVAGVVLFCYFHYKPALRTESKGGNRGKNKRNRGPRRHKGRAWVVYDKVEDILDMYHNGDSVTPKNGPLAEGYWVWTTRVNGKLVEHEVLIEGGPADLANYEPNDEDYPFESIDVREHEKFVRSVPSKGKFEAGPAPEKHYQCSVCKYELDWHKIPLCAYCEESIMKELVALAPKQESTKPLPPTPKKGKGAEKTTKPDPREALIPSSPKVDFGRVHGALGIVLNKDNVEISQCVACWLGILVNKHAYDQAVSFKFGDKVHPKTAVAYEKVSGNADFIVCKSYDGAPKHLSKKHFQVPEKDLDVTLVCAGKKHSVGKILCASEQGAFGTQMRCSCSSEDGDCGGPYVNSNGCVVGIHFSEGDKKKSNLGIPVTESFLALVPKN